MYVFQPSEILDKIYNEVLPHYETGISNEYEIEVMKGVQKFMETKYPEVGYTDEYFGDGVYGSYAVSWVEDGKPVLLLITYIG